MAKGIGDMLYSRKGQQVPLTLALVLRIEFEVEAMQTPRVKVSFFENLAVLDHI